MHELNELFFLFYPCFSLFVKFVKFVVLFSFSLNHNFTSIEEVNALCRWLSVELAAVQVVETTVVNFFNFDNFFNSCCRIVDLQHAGVSACLLITQVQHSLTSGYLHLVALSQNGVELVVLQHEVVAAVVVLLLDDGLQAVAAAAAAHRC